MLLLVGGSLWAGEPATGRKMPGQTFLLVCSEGSAVFKLPPRDLHWQELHKQLDDQARRLIQMVDRSRVDPALHIDTEGLRLYVGSREGLTTFRQLPTESSDRLTLAYLVRNLLVRRYSETGIEPDRVPVQGEAGRKQGTQGMVFIKGGMYVRPGHYYTSQSAELGERKGDRYGVQVSSFWIDKYKVTNAEYCRFLNDGNPGYWNSAPWSNIRRERDGRFVVDADKASWPVIAVNWYQAAGFAEWAGKRLPREAEWEFAAGGCEGRKYPWGDQPPDKSRGHSATSGNYTPVDAFPAGATPDGVFGLAGNAAEWCADYYSHDYYDKAPPGGVRIDPQGPAVGSSANGYARMFKGFCQGRSPEFLTCTKRHARNPLLTAAIGFRCVKDGPKTWLLSCANDGMPIRVSVVDRAEIKPQHYLDLAGLRLWVDDAESLRRVRARCADPAAAWRLVQVTLAEKLRETGIEPDTVPVRGEQGKQMGTEGMVLLEGGEFTRPGEFYDSSGGGLTILPDGSVRVSRGEKYRVRVSSFRIDKYKVTNEDYCKFLNDGNATYGTPWNPRIARSAIEPNIGKFVPADRSLAKHPVVLVNWYQAKGYASWADKRLPTESEWEYAAGGKEGRKYPWGNEPPDETRGDFPVQYRHPVPVDWFPRGATPEGVFQMAQNSAEWCADYFDYASYVKAPPDGVRLDPTGPAQGFLPQEWYKFNVVMKGWCKASKPEHFTCTKRHGRGPLTDAPAGISIRCVKSAAR